MAQKWQDVQTAQGIKRKNTAVAGQDSWDAPQARHSSPNWLTQHFENCRSIFSSTGKVDSPRHYPSPSSRASSWLSSPRPLLPPISQLLPASDSVPVIAPAPHPSPHPASDSAMASSAS